MGSKQYKELCIKDPPPYMKVITQSSNEHFSVFSIMCCCEFNSSIEKNQTRYVPGCWRATTIQIAVNHAPCAMHNSLFSGSCQMVPRPCWVLRVPCECTVHISTSVHVKATFHSMNNWRAQWKNGITVFDNPKRSKVNETFLLSSKLS